MKSIICAAVFVLLVAAPTWSEEVADLQGPYPAAGDFQVAKLYSGPTRLPDFKGRDKDFRLFRTRIRDGLKEGPNFAGEYRVIQYGCGTGCSDVVIASNRTGQAFNFPLGGEENAYLSLQFSLQSRLMAAQWYDFDKDSCIIDFYDWQAGKARLVKRGRVGTNETCYNEISDNLNKADVSQQPAPVRLPAE